jgi:membrane-associated protease RseP (regulator of RpoE activity)
MTSTPHDTAPTEPAARPPRTFVALALIAALTVAVVWPPSRGYALTLAALLALVTLHEAGHFLAARRLGAKTPEFSVGFGPVLWSTYQRGTTWSLRAVPLGGFVRIDGMETGGPEPTSTGNTTSTPSSAAEPTTPVLSPWRQIVIAAAGPAANIAVAFLLFAALFGAVGVPTATGGVTPTAGSPAAAAGVIAGDKVVAIDGTPTATWEEMRSALDATAPGEPVTVSVESSGVVRDVTVDPEVAADGRNLLGVTQESVTERLGPVAAVGEAASASVETLRASVLGIANIGRAFTSLPGQFTSPEEAPEEDRVLSPIGAAQLATSAASEDGIGGVLALAAMVSMFLAVFNLLPIPPFDGGHIVLNAADAAASAVRRRPVRVDRRKVMPIAMAVTVAVLVLGVSSLVLDIVNPIAW